MVAWIAGIRGKINAIELREFVALCESIHAFAYLVDLHALCICLVRA